MELTGESVLAAGRDRVWAALNDPEVLARCIDGVESLDGDDRFKRRDAARRHDERPRRSGPRKVRR